MPSTLIRRDTDGNWLDRCVADVAAFRDRFAGTIQDVCGAIAIVAFLTAAIFWLPVLV